MEYVLEENKGPKWWWWSYYFQLKYFIEESKIHK
jgi:hypothetical protein